MLSSENVASKVRRLRDKFALRDQRMRDISAVRRGDTFDIAPHLFPPAFPKAMVANFIDVAARDLAESASDLPAFNCSSANMVSDQARKRADKRTKIAHYYVDVSNLGVNMVSAMDRYFSYGQLVFYVEPDFDKQCPVITVEDPQGGYPEMDRFGRCVSYSKVITKSIDDLISEYPEYRRQILGPMQSLYTTSTTSLEVVRYVDADQFIMFIPDRGDLVLKQTANPLGKCPFVVRRRPGLDDEVRGQFDEVIWVQVARAKFALLAMEAAEKSIQAPVAVPEDADDFVTGPDAIIRTREPQNIRRVGLEIPQGAFAEMANLTQELRIGSRYPEGRTGNIDASVVTGQGVQALLSGYDGQIKTAQVQAGDALEEAVYLAFCMDEKLWAGVEKTIRGTKDGSPFEVTYVPAKDIKGDYTVDVTYGMLGLDKNRALVFLLQLRGDRLVSRDFVRRQMPFPLDVTEEDQKVDIEETRDALKQAIAGMAVSIPQLAAQGMDVTQTVRNLAEVVRRRQKGEALEVVLSEVLAPEAPPAPADETLLPGEQPLPGGGEGAPAGLGGSPDLSALPGVGGAPDLSMMLAGLTSSGQPNLQAAVSRRIPA